MLRLRIVLAFGLLLAAGCQVHGPDSTVPNGGINVIVSAPPGMPAPLGEFGPGSVLPADIASAHHIVGHVYTSPVASAGYRLAEVTRLPVGNAVVQVRSFNNPTVLEVGSSGTSNATGAYNVGASDTTTPLYVMAQIPNGQGTTTLLAPVPLLNDPTITVDLDLESTMLTEALLENERVPGAANLQTALSPATLLAVRQHMDQALTDGNVDASSPTQLFASFQALAKTDPTVAGAVQLVTTAATPSPLPSPITYVPPNPAPGAVANDPPFSEATGPETNAAPRASSYLAASFTGLVKPGKFAARRFTKEDDIFFAAIDQASDSLFGFFHDEGNPAHLANTATGVTGALDVALDAASHMYMLTADRLVQLAVTLGPAAASPTPVVTGLHAAAALAVDPSGTHAYVATADGKVQKFALPAGTNDASFSSQLAPPITALVANDDGSVVAAHNGVVTRLAATGTPDATNLATLPDVRCLASGTSSRIFAGVGGSAVWDVTPGKTASQLFSTDAAVTGLACVGNYMYLVLATGALESSNVAPLSAP